MIDKLRLTAEEAAGLLESGEASGDELAGAYVEAIGERDSELHAYLHVVGESGNGVPIALKDNITTRGVPTTAGSASSRATSPSSTPPLRRGPRRPGCRSWGRPTSTSSPWVRPRRTRRSDRVMAHKARPLAQLRDP